MNINSGLESHKAALQETHQQVSLKLEKEINRPSPDPAIINNLKKEKLRLKDRIESL